jgi:hypothetical protein
MRNAGLLFGTLLVFSVLHSGAGCIHGHCFMELQVAGSSLLDAETGAPLVGWAVGGATFTADTQTAGRNALTIGGLPQAVTETDGSINLLMTGNIGVCPPPKLPRPDEVEIQVARESLPLELDPQPEWRSGDDLRIVCPCEQQFRVPINENTAELLETVDSFISFIVQLRDPILVPSTCEACCSLLAVRGRISGEIDEAEELSEGSVNRLGDDGGSEQFRLARRLLMNADGSFETWFADIDNACPPGETFAVPDEFSVYISGSIAECERGVNVDLRTANLTVTEIDPEGPFPRTVVELNDPIVIPPCNR